MIRFIIDNHHVDGLAYEVRIYSTRRLYLAAVNRREAHFSEARDNFSQATTFNDRRWWILEGGREVQSPIVGAIYLHSELLDAQIVTHECVHAALNLYRRRHRGVAALGRNLEPTSCGHEEEVALSAGRLGVAIADQCWEHRVWTNNTRPRGRKR